MNGYDTTVGVKGGHGRGGMDRGRESMRGRGRGGDAMRELTYKYKKERGKACPTCDRSIALPIYLFQASPSLN